MNYTVMSIEGPSKILQGIRELLLPDSSPRFHYAGVFPTPEWLTYVPEHTQWIIDEPTEYEMQILDQLTRTTSQSTTLRTWFIDTLMCVNNLRSDHPNLSVRPKFTLNQTIFDRRLMNLVEELSFQKSIRPHLGLQQIYGKDVTRVIESYLCSYLFQTTQCRSRADWINRHNGVEIDGVLVEEQSDLTDREGQLGFCVQTVGGTPWPFFKALSQLHPTLKISISDVDIERSIIQMKIYRQGKIVTTMTTEDTTILPCLNQHTTLFGGAYFYLPLTHY